MHMKIRTEITYLNLIVSIAVWFINCQAPERPVDFKAGEHDCHYCKMKITDLRFRGQIITHKGKIHNFDSIECLKVWSYNNKENINSSWVSDYTQNKWIHLNKALIFHSEKLKSPMGAGLSAYENKQSLSKAQSQFSGSLISDHELEAHIKTWHKKTFKKE